MAGAATQNMVNTGQMIANNGAQQVQNNVVQAN